MWGMTPHFTIRVWGSPGEYSDSIDRMLGNPRRRVPVCEIEMDTTDEAPWNLTIGRHRGLDLIPQKMLTS